MASIAYLLRTDPLARPVNMSYTRLIVPALPELNENLHLPACSTIFQVIEGMQPVSARALGCADLGVSFQ